MRRHQRVYLQLATKWGNSGLWLFIKHPGKSCGTNYAAMATLLFAHILTAMRLYTSPRPSVSASSRWFFLFSVGDFLRLLPRRYLWVGYVWFWVTNVSDPAMLVLFYGLKLSHLNLPVICQPSRGNPASESGDEKTTYITLTIMLHCQLYSYTLFQRSILARGYWSPDAGTECSAPRRYPVAIRRGWRFEVRGLGHRLRKVEIAQNEGILKGSGRLGRSSKLEGRSRGAWACIPPCHSIHLVASEPG